MECNFIFCLHNHQPVGNFDHVFEWGFNDCYNKALRIFSEYPEFRFAVHHSGPLLEWIEVHHPDYIETLRMMAQRGQVEIIGGGFYEPIFSVISESDIRGQLALMQRYCASRFGAAPRGFWTAERVWDPEIPRLVDGFNLEYTILDDNHFRYAGVPEDDLYGYYTTERLHYPLKVFPIDKFLRYSIPFRMPRETIDYFREKTEKLGRCAFVYGDDGEKFGMWPGTFTWVFEEKWLVNFIEAVLAEPWIRMMQPSEFIAVHPPKGRVYLTQGSYFELSEWALPPQAASQLMKLYKEIKDSGREQDFYSFVKGGVWNNFLTKYPESNAINKRTLLLSREIGEFNADGCIGCDDITRELYRSECNCAYWHGLFGGIYLSNLRHALYEHLLAAEGMLMERRRDDGISVVERDYWNEGGSQILVRTRDSATVIVPYMGGTLAEFSSYAKRFNICNVMPRRYEAYHEVLAAITEEQEQTDAVKSIHDMVMVKEKGLKDYLVYDATRRYSFKDMLFADMPAAADLMRGSADVCDCGSLPYSSSGKYEGGGYVVALRGGCEHNGSCVDIEKKFVISGDGARIRVEYAISGMHAGCAGVELNLNLLGAHDDDRYYDIEGVAREDSFLDSMGECEGIRSFRLVDAYNGFMVRIASSLPATLLRYPIFTVSQSDRGFEKNYQGCSLVFVYRADGGMLKFSIETTIAAMQAE